MTKSCGFLSEIELVHRLRLRLRGGPGVVGGIGDDTAVVRPLRGGFLQLFTCDGLVEGVHFDRKLSPYLAGRKAMARNISDIAAMGGMPTYALTGLALPERFSARMAGEIFRGLNDCALQHGALIVGGDTVRSPSGLHIWVSLLGRVEPRCLKTRGAARPGDAIFVTGRLGGSLLGKHAKFSPRLREARYLVKNFPVHAMMDLSDGLGMDLPRICAESTTCARIQIDLLPISRQAKKLATKRTPAWYRAVADGEDYELLLCAPALWEGRMARAFKKNFHLEITRIGEIIAGPSRCKRPEKPDSRMVRYFWGRTGREMVVRSAGYDHFAS